MENTTKIGICVTAILGGLLLLLTITAIQPKINEPSQESVNYSIQELSVRFVEKVYTKDGKFQEKTLLKLRFPILPYDAVRKIPLEYFFPFNLVGSMAVRDITVPEGYINCGKEDAYKTSDKESSAIRKCFVDAFNKGQPAFMEIIGYDEEGWVGVKRLLVHKQAVPIIEYYSDQEDPHIYDRSKELTMYYVYFNTTCGSLKTTPKEYGGYTILHLSLENCKGPEERIWVG